MKLFTADDPAQLCGCYAKIGGNMIFFKAMDDWIVCLQEQMITGGSRIGSTDAARRFSGKKYLMIISPSGGK